MKTGEDIDTVRPQVFQAQSAMAAPRTNGHLAGQAAPKHIQLDVHSTTASSAAGTAKTNRSRTPRRKSYPKHVTARPS